MANGQMWKIDITFALICALLLASNTTFAQIQTFAFEPIVINTNIIEPSILSVQTDGSLTSLELEFANGTERSLSHQGDGLYTISVTHEEALFGYQSDDVNRNFVGFLNAYSGGTRLLRGNIIINVEDESISETIIDDLAANIRLSPHVVNFHLPEVDLLALNRADISNLFYEYFPDNFDFLNIVSTPAIFGNRFYAGIQNSILGIGVSIFDSSESHGSAGRLLGIVRFPFSIFFDLASRAYSHELGHRWINFSNSPKLQGVKPHWPLSSLAIGVMGYQTTGQGLNFLFDIIELSEDQYQFVAVGQPSPYFNGMELYLMGMNSAANAGFYVVLENQAQIPCGGCIVQGAVVDFNVFDLIESDGERIPAFPNAQVDFRAATIIVSKTRLLTHREMNFFDHFAARGEATEELLFSEGFAKGSTLPFRLATNEVGSLSTTIYDDVAFQINLGLSGAWFNPETSGQGQFIDVEPGEKFMFISWFTYTDAASDHPNEQQWYTAQGNYSGNTAELELFETLGGKFDDPTPVNTTKVGTTTATFNDCGEGQMAYNFDDGRQGQFPMQRVIPGSDNVCEGLSGTTTQAVDINAGMDGAWFDPDTPGQGFFIDAHPDPEGGNFIFVAWFTFGEDTASGQRWLTAQGSIEGSIAEIDVFETTGGSFDDPQATSTTKVGTMSLDFTDCSNAQLTYSLTDNGAEGDIDITRVIPGGKALCEELVGAN